MDEVELVIKGKVDDWRKQREFAYGIMLSSGMYKVPPDMMKTFPLPYDDELTDKMSQDEAIELYKQFEGRL